MGTALGESDDADTKRPLRQGGGGEAQEPQRDEHVEELEAGPPEDPAAYPLIRRDKIVKQPQPDAWTTLGETALAQALVRPVAYYLFHSWRLFGYLYAIPPLLMLRPAKTLLGLATYGAIHRQEWWQKTVHRFLGYGASRKTKLVAPYRHLYRDDKRYLWCLHPHSLLADGWHTIIAKNLNSFDHDGNGPPLLGRKVSLCFAPVISHVPVHQEMYRDYCGGADKKTLLNLWKSPDTDPCLCPGGFAESVFTNAWEKNVEYSYIKDRKGFIRICLEQRKDIVSAYSFKANWMYYNPGWLKGLRARISQNIHLGLVFFIGKMGSSMPLCDDTTTVVFPPFEVTKYTVDQLDECHAAYKVYLKKYFDMYKGQYGMANVELKFVGNDFVDDDPLAKALQRIGLLKGQGQRSKL